MADGAAYDTAMKAFRHTTPPFGRMSMLALAGALLFGALSHPLFAGPSANAKVELLIVGGNESACAAAVQAARLGVENIMLVTDTAWLGGQFSSEGVGCVDEWTTVEGRRVNFPRSGLFLEMMERIRARNSMVYGLACPGNAFCGTDTIEPTAAAALFDSLVAPAVESGRLRIVRGLQPFSVEVEGGRVVSVSFKPAPGGLAKQYLQVEAKLTLDATDWGDVIRLSGAAFGAGPDLRSRFQEPSAPEAFDEAGAQEMNPLSWVLTLRETGGKPAVIPRPATYDARSYRALDKIAPWVESDMSGGIYSPSGNSPYTHRRLVDRWHNGLKPGTEATFLNYPVQDYPLCQLPQRVVDALEKTEPGASRKNIVHMTPAQREIIFADARQHALGMLYHLQTAVHDRVGDFPQSFRYMALTDEYGTADQLPPKPYIREGLRLEALYMLRETDIRAAAREPRWARALPPDSIFAFQFNIDFHPTRRKFLTADRNGPWVYVHTESRGWHTDTDRAVFPLRGLVPVKMEGLLGAGKNIGVSSVVHSALRLHGQMMHVGQAAGTLAWMSLKKDVPPRSIAASPASVRELQLHLVRGCGGPGVLLWPWQDLRPDDLAFEAANMLAVRGIWQPAADNVFFRGDSTLTRAELAAMLARVRRSIVNAPEWPKHQTPLYTDVPSDHAARAGIEAMVTWGDFKPLAPAFNPEGIPTRGTLHGWLKRLGLPVSRSLADDDGRALTRSEAAIALWRAVRLSHEAHPPELRLEGESDTDQDGRPDLEDPTPQDGNNDNVPDLLHPRDP